MASWSLLRTRVLASRPLRQASRLEDDGRKATIFRPLFLPPARSALEPGLAKGLALAKPQGLRIYTFSYKSNTHSM